MKNKDCLSELREMFSELISFSLMAFVPKQDTVYKMLIANFVTYDNVDQVKEAIDYGLDRVEQMMKD